MQRQMVQKFIKERQNGTRQADRTESGETYAVEQVETLTTEIVHLATRPAKHRAAARKDSALEQPQRCAEQTQQPQSRDARIKQYPASEATPAPQNHPRSAAPPFEQPATRTADLTPELRQTVIREKPPATSAVRDLPPAPTPQRQMLRSFLKKQKQSAQNPSIESIHPHEPKTALPPQRPLFDTTAASGQSSAATGKLAQPSKKPQVSIAAQQPISQGIPLSTKKPTPELPQIREKTSQNAAPREKPRRGILVKTRETVSPNIPHIQPYSTHTLPKTATAKARQHATQQAQRRMLHSSKRAGKTAAAGKKLAKAAAKAGKELIGALAGLGGGVALLVVFCVLIVAGALLASPLGILFADEQKNADPVPLATAIAEIQGEYHAELERLQSGDFASVQIIGQAPDWREVVAVFASKTAGADDGLDVFTLDAARVALLRQVFWDMCQITTSTHTLTIPDSDPNDGIDDSHTEIELTISITAKTAEQMRLEYAFSKYQNDALDVLLENLSSLHIPMGSLTISQEEAKTLLENLPDELDPNRKAVVETALQLVGKITYFWGGKSLALGWDARWGVPTEVTAEGSGSTGTVRPFGLDCSGFVDWVFYNATNGVYYPGHGGGAATQHSYCTDIPWSEAQSGDLVFYPDDSHVGIVGGTDADGNLLIIHCSGGANGVVITGAGPVKIYAQIYLQAPAE